MRRVTIDPLTRIEGHGRIDLFLDDAGGVAEAYFVGTELRGFERLCLGRPVEEMPGLTSRICGLCPEAHHLASVKALDVLFGVEPPPAARLIRELLYMSFIVSNHATHFFALAAPDLLLPPDTPVAERNLLGVLQHLGPELGRRVLANRVRNSEMIELLGGRRIHLVAGLPGGWSRAVSEADRTRLLAAAHANVAFARECLNLYCDQVLGREDYSWLLGVARLHLRLHSLGTVDAANRLQLYDGMLRVVDPTGGEFARFAAREYREHIAERVETWTYLKLPYLRRLGWQGLCDGETSGIYAVGPLARLNACDELSTPRARRARETMYSSLSSRAPDGRYLPVHARLATHWARLVEQLHAAERMVELAEAPELTDPEVRSPVPSRPVVQQAVGCVEAPRGTLLHRYRVDDEGLVTEVDLVVATTSNHAAIALTLTGVARELIRPGGDITEPVLNQIEMAIRAHDPCLACATHTYPGGMPLRVVVRDRCGAPIAEITRAPCTA